MVDGDKLFETPLEVVDLDCNIVPGAAAGGILRWTRLCVRRLATLSLLHQHHKSVLKPGRRRLGDRTADYARLCSPRVALHHQPDLPALRHRIDDIGLVEQPGLEIARLHSCRRLGEESAAERQTAEFGRRPFRQFLALVKNQYLFASFGLVKIAAAEQDG